MNKVWELLQEADTVVLFDVDGTLTSYNYGEYHAHHELDFTPEFRDVNIYADCRRLLPMYNYIQKHGTDRIFCISKEPHGHEAWKSEMLGRLYGIPESHCCNVIGDVVFDLTSEQFGDEILDYTDNPEQFREDHFSKMKKYERYLYLRSELKKLLSLSEN